MDNLDDLKNLWQQLPTQSLDSAQDMISKATHYQRTMKRKTLFSIALLAATFVFIGIIGYLIEPHYVTTRIGVVLVMLSILMFVVVQSQLIALLSPQESLETDSRQYLQQFLAYQKKVKWIQSTVLSLYFVLLSIGLGLYMFEYVVRMPMWMRWAVLVPTVGWMAFNWFYLRVRQIRKQQNKINEIIDQLERVQQQL